MSEPWFIDYLAELNKRKVRIINFNNELSHLRSGVMAYYKTHPVEWIEDWCWTFDPRRTTLRTLPFVLFPRQRQFVEFLEYCRTTKHNGLVEKCRDAGMTWLCVCYAVWLWLFHDGVSIGFGSRKEELVDRLGDNDSIIEKGRFVIRYLPQWMLPYKFNSAKHLNYLKLTNTANGAMIKGEGGDNIGRGGRSTMYFKDESAHYERPEKIEASLGDNTDVQIDISSVNGTANVFYRRRQSGVVWQPGVDIEPGMVAVFIFDWHEDPRKTQEWYDTRKARAEREGLLHIFAQEVDRDYSAALEGIIIKAEWVRACIDADKKLAHLGDWLAGEKMAAQDIADGGGDRNAYAGRHGPSLIRIESWGGEAGDAAHKAIPYTLEDGILDLYYDCIGVGTGFKVECNNMREKPTWPLGLRVFPWDASAVTLNPEDSVIPGDDRSPKNEDVYENLKAQAWFLMRSRVWKTYLAVTRGEVFDPAELISLPSYLPNVQQLVMEMSQPVKKLSLATGKTVVDKKPEGSLSPNMADAVVMCYCPTREVSIFDVL